MVRTPRTTVRIIEGQAQESNFVSPGAYEHYLAAQIAQHRGDLGAAEHHFKLAVVHDEKSAYLHIRLAEIYRLQGKLKRAHEHLAEALRLAPDFPDALIMKGQIFFQERRTSQAEACLKQVIQTSPKHPRGYLVYGQILQEQERAAEARQVLQRLVANLPEFTEGHNQLSLLCLRQMDYPCAVQHLQRVLQQRWDLDTLMALAQLHRGLGQLPQAIKYLREAFDRSDGNLEVATVLLEVLDQGQHEQSVRDLQLVLEASLDQDPARVATLARVYLQLQRFAEALVLVERQLQQGDQAELQILRGSALMALGQEGPGEELLRGHLQGEHRAMAARALAHRLWASARTTAAVEVLRSALAQESGQIQLIQDYSSALYFDGQHEPAVRVLQQALQQRPDSRALRFGLGMALERVGRFVEALGVMAQLIKDDPTDAAAHNFIGYSLLEHGGDMARAERSIRRALFLYPGEGYIIDSLGWLYYRRGQLPKAKELLAMAVRLAPREAEVIGHLAAVHVALKDEEGARSLYKRALLTPLEDPILAAQLQENLRLLEKGQVDKQ